MATYTELCPICGVSGKVSEEKVIPCRSCNGIGLYTDMFGITYSSEPNCCHRCKGMKQEIISVSVECPQCKGDGRIILPKPPTIHTKVKLTVQLTANQSNDVTDVNLKEIMRDDFTEYLHEFMVNDLYIEQITISEIPDNNTIILDIEHSGSPDDLHEEIETYIEENAAYSDYFALFYEDEEQNLFPLQIKKHSLIL